VRRAPLTEQWSHATVEVAYKHKPMAYKGRTRLIPRTTGGTGARVAKQSTERKALTRADAAEAPQLDLGGLESLVGFHLRMAMIAVSRHWNTCMASLDMTQKQAGVLWLIGANAGVSQIVLANAVLMDRASMMAIIDRLEERGLIIRKKSARDGRKQELYLTPKGRQVMVQSKVAVGRNEDWIKSHFTPEQLEVFMAAVTRIHG
jgi:DNA-binding MarR family transcriptional regulator